MARPLRVEYCVTWNTVINGVGEERLYYPEKVLKG
jgi:hypothetical protein